MKQLAGVRPLRGAQQLFRVFMRKPSLLFKQVLQKSCDALNK